MFVLQTTPLADDCRACLPDPGPGRRSGSHDENVIVVPLKPAPETLADQRCVVPGDTDALVPVVGDTLAEEPPILQQFGKIAEECLSRLSDSFRYLEVFACARFNHGADAIVDICTDKNILLMHLSIFDAHRLITRLLDESPLFWGQSDYCHGGIST